MSKSEELSRRFKVVYEELKAKGSDVRQIRLAQIIQARQSMVSEILTGSRPFSAKYVMPFAEAYGVNPAYLLSGEQPMFGKTKVRSVEMELVYIELSRLDFRLKKLERKIAKDERERQLLNK